MRKKILIAFCLITSVLTLAACGSKDNSKEQQVSSSNTSKKVPAKLTVKNITAEQQASAIAIYAAQKYKGAWRKAYRQAQKSNLSVSPRSTTGLNHIFKKQNYIYEVSGNGQENDAFYSIKDEKVNFYNHKKKLGTASLTKILTYLNDHQYENKVKKLSVNLSAAITAVKYGVKGDKGLVEVPKKLQGTWYNKKGKKLVVTAYTINGEEIHKIASSGLTTTTFNQTKKWARARIENINEINCYHVQSLNAQDFGLLYTVQKENGQVAVVTYSVDTGSYLNSYWKSTKIARANTDASFKSLK